MSRTESARRPRVPVPFTSPRMESAPGGSGVVTASLPAGVREWGAQFSVDLEDRDPNDFRALIAVLRLERAHT